MKQVKLTKKSLKHPVDTLAHVGAVDASKTVSFPQHVYLSKEDYKTIRNNVKLMVNKEMSFYSKQKKDVVIEMTLLNWGPNETLADAIKPGYALVDVDAIEKENVS